MNSSVEKLLSVASPPLGPGIAESSDCPDALVGLLSIRDGFYAFESALHVFPSCRSGDEIGGPDWNAPDLWRHAYPWLPRDVWFFAEDAFGGQFGLAQTGVVVLDPETGELERRASDVEDWAAILLTDHRRLTGWPLAREWQERNGALAAGQRLIPKIPFVLGGDFGVANLYAADAVAAMRYRGELAHQLRELPDGSEVRLRIIE